MWKSLFCNCVVIGAFDDALLCSLNRSYDVVEELSQNPADPVVSLMGAPLLFLKRIVCLECPLMCSHNTLLTEMSYTACWTILRKPWQGVWESSTSQLVLDDINNVVWSCLEISDVICWVLICVLVIQCVVLLSFLCSKDETRLVGSCLVVVLPAKFVIVAVLAYPCKTDCVQ